MRYLLFGVIGLIALVVGAAAIGPAFVDWNSYKDTIAAEVYDATGRTLEINGDLALSVLPAPRLSASDVRLTGRPGSGQAEMARLGALRVHVRLMPLLSGEVEVTSLTLVDPVVVYDVLPDGASNWDIAPPGDGKAERTARPAGTPPRAGADGRKRSVRFDRMRVENGSVIYRNRPQGIERKLEKISADVSAASLDGPFEIKGDLTSAETPLGFEARIGSLAAGGAAPVEIALSVSDDPATTLTFKGRLIEIPDTPRLVGALQGKSADLSKLAAAVAGSDRGDKRFAAWRGQPFDLKTRLDASSEAVAFNDLALNLAGMRGTGAISLGIGGKVQLDVAVKARQLDVDKLRTAFMPATSASSGPAAKSAPAATPAKRSPASALVLPSDVGGSIDVAVESLTFMGRRVRGLKLAASLTDGTLTINQATGRFPGGAEAAVSGLLSSKGGKPKFEGKVVARARSLRETLDWLKVDLGDVARDRLRKFQISGKVRADETQIQVTDVDLAMDATRIKGGVTYALRDRPSFGASIALDKINLDAYLPGPAAQKAAAGSPTGSQAKANGRAATTDAATLSMPFLNDFDANVAISVGSLTYRQTPIQGVRLNGTLLAGKMTIKRAVVRSVGGARLGAQGTLTNFAGFPAFKGTIDADAKNPAGLFRVLGITPIEGAGKLGRLKLTGKADTDQKRLIVDTKFSVAGGELTVAGSIVDYRDKPTLDLTLNGNHPDFRRLAAMFGTELPPGKSGSGRLQLTATVKGPPDVLALKTDIKALGGSASVAGQIKSPAQTEGIDLTIGFKHPDAIALMRAVAPDYRPAGKKIGAFSLAGRVQGGAEKMTVDQIRAAVGPTELSGTAELGFAGARPSLTASLTASDLILDPLLPAEETDARRSGNKPQPGQAQAAPTARPGGRYSREPFDTSALDSLDAALTLTAKSISRRRIKVDEAQVVASLKDRVLTLTKAEGKVFDGTLSVTGVLNGTGVPAVDATVAVRKASVEKALFEAADFDLASGVLDLDIDVKGAGGSEHDLIASLNGDAKINARDGVVKGFDLPAVSERLKNLNRTTDILSLFAAGMGGGSTKFSRLDGTFQIKDGIASTTDTKLVAEAGEGTALGTIDLPRWVINMDTEFRLSEHPKAPPFGMRLRGPVDEPRRIFQFQDLQAFLLRRSVNRFLKKVLPPEQKPAAAKPPGAAKPPAAAKAPSPPPPSPKPSSPKIRPEDILRDLLQGLQRP